MNLRKLIQTLLDVEVDTDDMATLRINPRSHVNSEEAAQKIKDLFLLIDMTEGEEGNPYDEH